MGRGGRKRETPETLIPAARSDEAGLLDQWRFQTADKESSP